MEVHGGVIWRAWGGVDSCDGKRMILENFAEMMAPEQPEGAKDGDVLGERAPGKGKNRDKGHLQSVQGPAREPLWLEWEGEKAMGAGKAAASEFDATLPFPMNERGSLARVFRGRIIRPTFHQHLLAERIHLLQTWHCLLFPVLTSAHCPRWNTLEHTVRCDIRWLSSKVAIILLAVPQLLAHLATCKDRGTAHSALSKATVWEGKDQFLGNIFHRQMPVQIQHTSSW